MKQHLLREDSFLINKILKCKLADKVANPNLFYSLKTVATINMYAYPWASHDELASLHIIFYSANPSFTYVSNRYHNSSSYLVSLVYW